MQDSTRHRAPDFTLRQLGHLSAIVDAGSISAASTAIHVSPSALAASLDELERALGTRLCVRRKAHGVNLTADGARVLQSARALLGAAQDLAARVGSDPAGPLRGTLRVGCYHTLSPTVLPMLVQGMRVRHPELDLEVEDADGDELQRQVASGDLDMAVMYDRDVAGDVEVERLYELVPYVLLAAGHRLAGQPAVRLADLRDDPLILLDLPPSRTHTLGLFSAHGIVPRVRHRTGGFELTRAMVGRGLGYAVLVQRTRTTDTYEGLPVTAVEVSPPMPPVGVVLLRARGRNDARVAAVTDYLRRELGDGADRVGQARGRRPASAVSTTRSAKAASSGPVRNNRR